MMANRIGCDYGTRGAFCEQAKQFVWHTGQQAAVAMVVNALFMYLLGEEDVVPGLINGGVTALSINTVHNLEKQQLEKACIQKLQTKKSQLWHKKHFAWDYLSCDL